MLSRRRTIIPVLHRDCEVPYRLNRLQYVDFRTSYDEGLKYLLLEMKGNPDTFPVPLADHRSRGWYLLAAAAAIAGLLTWSTFGHRPVPGDRKPRVEQQAPERVATEPPPQSSAPGAGHSQPAPTGSFQDSFRTALLRYMAEAPTGFQALGAKEWVDWTPSVSLPGAASCRGSGYPREPLVECVPYGTGSEAEATNKFEDLIELTRATLPDWEASRINMFVAYFSSKRVASLVRLDVKNSGDHFDLLVSVRRQ